MAGARIPLSDDLQRQIEDAARAENRKPTELLEEAVRKYLDERSWVATLVYGRQRAEAAGIATEEGVDQAIANWRKRNAQPMG